MGVSKNRGIPKWMVYFMENPMNKWMIWGYHYFWKHPNGTDPYLLGNSLSFFEFCQFDSSLSEVDPMPHGNPKKNTSHPLVKKNLPKHPKKRVVSDEVSRRKNCVRKVPQTFQVMQLSMVPSFEPILDLFPLGMPSAVRLVTDPDTWQPTRRTDSTEVFEAFLPSTEMMLSPFSQPLKSYERSVKANISFDGYWLLSNVLL